MTTQILEPYIWGLIVTSNIMLALQATTLKVHLLQLYLKIRRKDTLVFTTDDFDNYVGDNWGLFGELLICPICLSHWMGAIVSLIFIYFGAPLFLAPLCFFSYPVFVYWVLKKLVYS